jgi:hypothetical protein
MSTIESPINAPKKRGRKSKKELLAALNLQEQSNSSTIFNNSDSNNINISIVEETNKNEINDIDNDNNTSDENVVLMEDKPLPKKRGRKPKGGKIIQPVISSILETDVKPNVILHLKCFIKDLQTSSSKEIDSFSFSNKKTDLEFDLLTNHENTTFNNNSLFFINSNDNNSNNINNNNINNNKNSNNKSCNYDSDDDEYYETNNKEVWQKLKQLEYNLHHNNISDKKCACFWDTCDFDNPPISIPKCCKNDIYEVYGCFCSPECAVAHLMEENLDSSTKFERYHMLNHIYSKPYNYKKNIKPAPNPYYMLDKFYGNLSIQEYRSLLQNDRLYLIVDKPLTRVLPELHEDNDEFILNNKIIPSNNYQVKKRLQKKPQNKSSIVNEKFGTLFA